MSAGYFENWIAKSVDRVNRLYMRSLNPLRLALPQWAKEMQHEADTCYGFLANIANIAEINDIDTEPYRENLEQAQQQLTDIQDRLSKVEMLRRVVVLAGQASAIIGAIHGSPLHLRAVIRGLLVRGLLGSGNNS